MTLGSLGDLHPCLALGMELKRNGCNIRVITTEYYRHKMERLGLEFRALRPDWDPTSPELIAPHLRPGLSMLLWPPFLWVLTLCVGLVRYQKQDLWLLIGAPLAFLNVIQVGIWLWSCTYHPTFGACPLLT